MRGIRVVGGASVAAAALVGAGAAAAQNGFNGTITFRSYEKSGPGQTMVQTTKGHRLRFDMGSGEGGGTKEKGAWMMDGDSHTTTILIPERKQYMQITPDDIKRNAERMTSSPRATAARARVDSVMKASKYDITKTGRTETVAGVKCEVYHASGMSNGRKHEGDVCVADGVGFALLDMAMGGGAMMGMGNPASRMPEMNALRDLLKGNRGVLKLTEVENGQNVTRLEAIKIDRTTPSDAVFAVPPGYTKFEMPSFPGRPPKP
ncbi:MAG: DUF4412 domain-containing protein [Gemmatimonadaceae bacterium]